MSVQFHTDELIERNVKPREGDFIEFGQVVYEIAAVTKPQLTFGQVQKKIMTRCVCIPSRQGQFQIHGDRAKFIDNTTPVNCRKCTDGDE